MPSSRGPGHSRGSKTVGLRLALIIVLLAVMGVAIGYTAPWVTRVVNEQARRAEQARKAAPQPPAAPETSGEASTAAEPAEAKPDGEELPKGQQPGEVAELPSLKKIDIDFDKAEAHLSDVKDGTYGIIEAGSLWLLKLAHDLPRELFAPDPEDQEVPYSSLMEAPVLYRGKPVTVSGTVGLVKNFPVGMEELPSVDTMWVVEIFKKPRGERHAWVCTVLVSDDPGDLKPKYTQVRMKGYFYKIRKYEFEEPDDPDEIIWEQTCPVVIGRYIEVVEKPAGSASPGSLLGSKGTVLMVATGVGLVVLMLIVLVFIRRFMARRSQYDVRPQRELTPEEIREREEFLMHHVPEEAPDQKLPGDW